MEKRAGEYEAAALETLREADDLDLVDPRLAEARRASAQVFATLAQAAVMEAIFNLMNNATVMA